MKFSNCFTKRFFSTLMEIEKKIGKKGEYFAFYVTNFQVIETNLVDCSVFAWRNLATTSAYKLS